MYGAILGDMIGAPYEFDRGNKTKDFPLFSIGSQFTDDSVMTIKEKMDGKVQRISGMARKSIVKKYD